VEPVRKDEWNVPEIVGLAVEPRRQPSREDMPRDSPWTGPAGTGKLAVEDASFVVEPHLPHAEARSVVLQKRQFHETNDVASRA
jgi:hypothetical protein